jgi:hypothetical protein
VHGVPQGAATSSFLCGLYLRHLANNVFLPATTSNLQGTNPVLDSDSTRSCDGPLPPPLLLLNMTDDFILLACDGAGKAQLPGRARCEALLADVNARQHLSFGAVSRVTIKSKKC